MEQRSVRPVQQSHLCVPLSISPDISHDVVLKTKELLCPSLPDISHDVVLKTKELLVHLSLISVTMLC